MPEMDWEAALQKIKDERERLETVRAWKAAKAKAEALAKRRTYYANLMRPGQ